MVAIAEKTITLAEFLELEPEEHIRYELENGELVEMPPEIVIEVVSPGKKNANRNYRQKRAQYQARGISEYWIVDPLAEKITILSLNEWLYDEAVFTGADILKSPWLEQHQTEETLTVEQVLQKK